MPKKRADYATEIKKAVLTNFIDESRGNLF